MDLLLAEGSLASARHRQLAERDAIGLFNPLERATRCWVDLVLRRRPSCRTGVA